MREAITNERWGWYWKDPMSNVPLLENAVLPLDGEELFSNNYFTSFCTLLAHPCLPSKGSSPLIGKLLVPPLLVNGVSCRFTHCRP